MRLRSAGRRRLFATLNVTGMWLVRSGSNTVVTFNTVIFPKRILTYSITSKAHWGFLYRTRSNYFSSSDLFSRHRVTSNYSEKSIRAQIRYTLSISTAPQWKCVSVVEMVMIAGWSRGSEGGREGGREGGKEGEKEGERERGREGERERGREGERERGGICACCVYVCMSSNVCVCVCVRACVRACARVRACVRACECECADDFHIWRQRF